MQGITSLRRVSVLSVTLILFIIAAWLLMALALGWGPNMPHTAPWCFNPDIVCMQP